jgi:hypothetical protein
MAKQLFASQGISFALHKPALKSIIIDVSIESDCIVT